MINFKLGKYSEIGEDAQEVRNDVFCVEQEIDESIEKDSCDESAMHIVVYEHDTPVATGRIVCNDDKYLIGRVSTLKEYRGKGYGTTVVKGLVEWAFSQNIDKVYLHAQKNAEKFYTKLGFESYGDVFFEVGIEHISMVIKNNKDE